MANILTAEEAARVLRTSSSDQTMLDLLPQVDSVIEEATGRDWAGDDPAHPLAKAAARLLLVRAYEDPGGLTAAPTDALTSLYLKLEIKAKEIAETP